MAYDEGAARRVREALAGRSDVVEKRMFGGLAFMASGHLCCGVLGSALVIRVGPVQYAQALRQAHTRVMDFSGRPMTGLVYVDPAGYADAADLQAWLACCQRYVDTLVPK